MGTEKEKEVIMHMLLSYEIISAHLLYVFVLRASMKPSLAYMFSFEMMSRAQPEHIQIIHGDLASHCLLCKVITHFPQVINKVTAE